MKPILTQGMKEMLKKHEAMILSAGVVGMMAYIPTSDRKIQVYKALYKATGCDYYRVRFIQMTHSNNWLKTHGYPMRRKRSVSRK